jgi:hypothetical protein
MRDNLCLNTTGPFAIAKAIETVGALVEIIKFILY